MPVATHKRSTTRTTRRSDSSPFHYDSGGRSTGTHGPLPVPQIDESLYAPTLADYEVDTTATERPRASRKVRRHRPLQMNLISIATGLFLLGQLVALLWLHGRALSAAHRADELDFKIAETRNGIARTQEQIAAYDASPRIAQWAQERGWQPAQQTDFDDITDRSVLPSTPVVPSTTTATSGEESLTEEARQ